MNDFTKNQPESAIANTLDKLTNTMTDLVEPILLEGDTALESTASNHDNIENNDVIELDRDFNFEGYQVVRREFFSHTNEPSVTFTNYKVYVNTACLKRFQSVDYIQAMVNAHSRTLLIRPSREEDRDVVPWCVPDSLQRKPRQITCKMFFANLFTLMGWNPDYRYKLLGKVIHAKNGTFIIFDLTASEVYQRVPKDGENSINSRAPIYTSGWQNQFGLPFEEHQKSMRINIVDGYAVYTIKDNRVVPVENILEELTQNLSDDVSHNGLAGGVNNEQ
jgi:hypothetical protein